MNTEVATMIGEEVDELAEGCSGEEFVELGEVSKDTKSSWWGGTMDAGAFWQFV